VKRNLHAYGFLIYLTCIFFFILALHPVLITAPDAQALVWAGAESKAILFVGNTDDETAVQSVTAVRKKLKELKADGVIKYKLLAYDFSVREHRKYLNELGIGASTLPLVAIVELNPNDSPKKVLWRTSAREPDSAVRALLSEMGIRVETATRLHPTLTGRWQANQPPYMGTLDLTQNGSKLSGTAAWDMNQSGDITGTVSGNLIEFTINYPGTLKGYYKATLSSDGMELLNGTTTSSYGDTATWTAKKIR
jgi:hypothetical protein